MREVGKLITPCDRSYKYARRDFNRAIQQYPCEIYFCKTVEEVQDSICKARSCNIPFRVRSGRHDFEGSSNITDGMVIDISGINDVSIDVCQMIATLGGGITSGKMYETLARAGYTIPSGTCGDVGLAGLTSCGGVGFATRWLGLACDQLLEVVLVDARGDLLIANEYEHADLFWAIKGGLVSNFGIAVSLTYRITPVKSASTYTVYWDGKYFEEVIKCWQSWAPYTDDRLSVDLTYIKDHEDKLYVSSRGQFFGTPEDLRILIEPLISCAPYIDLEIEELPYEAVNKKWSSACTLPEPFKATGSFIERELDNDTIRYLERAVKGAPRGVEQFLEFIVMQGEAGKINPSETAFVHRDALYLIEIKAVFDKKEDEAANEIWVEQVKRRLDQVGMGSYRGFTDCNLKDWEKQYYGGNYERLVRIKEEYDPENVFCFNQSIR